MSNSLHTVAWCITFVAFVLSGGWLLSEVIAIGWLPVSTKRVGGLRFVKIHRLTFSYCVSKQYRAF